MAMITEMTINDVALNIGEDETGFIEALHVMEAEQPVLLPYLFSESFDAFYQEEKEYVLFLVIVVFQAIKKEHPDLPPIYEEDLGQAEERNWEMMNSVTTKRFRDRLDVFFEDTEQEDLLAFIEDALADDEEGKSMVAPESREPIFIALKSIVDCLTGQLAMS